MFEGNRYLAAAEAAAAVVVAVQCKKRQGRAYSCPSDY